jgi:hypothetical protein
VVGLKYSVLDLTKLGLGPVVFHLTFPNGGPCQISGASCGSGRDMCLFSTSAHQWKPWILDENAATPALFLLCTSEPHLES